MHALDTAQQGWKAMKDMHAQLDKLRVEAANCKLLAKLAADPIKKETFIELAEHYKVLADEVQRAIDRANGEPDRI